MLISELFSKRQKKLRGEYSDVFQYENREMGVKLLTFHIPSGAQGALWFPPGWE